MGGSKSVLAKVNHDLPVDIIDHTKNNILKIS